MQPVHLRNAGVVCHTGRGLDSLHVALREPAPRPQDFRITELRPALGLSYLPARVTTRGNRLFALAEMATADALAGIEPTARARMPVFVASSALDLIGREPDYAKAIARGESRVAFMNPQPGFLAGRLARRFGLGGGQYTINTACSSGANALLAAAGMIRRGDCPQALVIGLETPGRVTLAGFRSLMLLSPTRNRPFDRRRNGIILGEAAAALVLDAEPGTGNLAGLSLAGGATGYDTASPTQTAGSAVAEVIGRALEQTATGELVAIKAHGTGTPGNDAAEALGIQLAGLPTGLPLTSLKPALGHTLGACGVLETLASAVCWRQGFLPPTAGFEQADPTLTLQPQSSATPLAAGRMLLNYFGFGGNNSVLVMDYAP